MNIENQSPDLPFAPSEDPFVVEHGGFYRRWFSMIDDIEILKETVTSLKSTIDESWVPAWSSLGKQYENEGELLLEKGNIQEGQKKLLQAKSFYSISRFPAPLTELKKKANEDCIRAYLRHCEFLDPPLQIVEVECEGQTITSHFRSPKDADPENPVPAVLIMCGGDMFKEDRGWAGEMALEQGLASLVMDGPGTGENPFPYEPSSVKAWMAAVDYLANRPEVDSNKVGAFGISRGGHSVLLLAGNDPGRVKAAVASAGHPFGYRMTQSEMDNFVSNRNKRATYNFGAPNSEPSFTETTQEIEEKNFKKWALSELGLVDKIVCPILMINGKKDHLAPIGNIYYMLEHGPVSGKEARIYPDDGHCAFKHFKDWAPESFRWLKEKLTHSK